MYVINFLVYPAIVIIDNNTSKSKQFMTVFESCLTQPSLWLSSILGFFIVMLPIYAYEKAFGLVGWRNKLVNDVR